MTKAVACYTAARRKQLTNDTAVPGKIIAELQKTDRHTSNVRRNCVVSFRRRHVTVGTAAVTSERRAETVR